MDQSQFSIQLKCLRLIGFDREKLVKSPRLSRFIQLMAIGVLVICLPGEANFVIENFKDVLAAAEACGPLLTVVVAVAKFTTLFISQKEFYQLLNGVHELKSELNIKNSLIIRKVNQFDKTLSFAYLISAGSAGVGLCFLPIITNIINMSFFGKNYNLEELPMKNAFPFKINYSPTYELIYLLYCGGTYVTVLVSVGVDCLIFGLCLNICAHFEILRDSFDGDKPKFIKRHQKLLDLAEQLKQLVKPIIFVQFLVTSIDLCVLAFQIVTLDSVAKKIITAPFAFSIIIQLYVYCYGGQLITEKTSSVADHFYQLDKDFVIIIARSQKPIVIEAAFYKATLTTFRTIMSSTASLITLLQSFLE